MKRRSLAGKIVRWKSSDTRPLVVSPWGVSAGPWTRSSRVDRGVTRAGGVFDGLHLLINSGLDLITWYGCVGP